MRSVPFETLQGTAFQSVSQRARGNAGILGAIWATLLTWQQRSVERHQMRDFTGEMMRDMGLDPVEVAHEAAKPFWRA